MFDGCMDDGQVGWSVYGLDRHRIKVRGWIEAFLWGPTF